MSAVVHHSGSCEVLQRVSPGFRHEKLLEARQKSWQVLREIQGLLREGMSELEARALALQVFLDWGVTQHWHQPFIRFGVGTLLTFRAPLQPDARLRLHDPVSIDLGPVWPAAEGHLAYEGDVGDTFVFGSHPEAEACALAARQIFWQVQHQWQSDSLNGVQIYALVQAQAVARGYVCVEKVDGHRIGDFPHHQYTRKSLKQLTFCPQEALWILEVQIADPQQRFAAFFEDLLLFSNPSADVS